MRAVKAKGRRTRTTAQREAGAPTIRGAAPATPEDPPRVLECAAKVLETTRDVETGRPLADLLRKIGYL